MTPSASFILRRRWVAAASARPCVAILRGLGQSWVHYSWKRYKKEQRNDSAFERGPMWRFLSFLCCFFGRRRGAEGRLSDRRIRWLDH